MTVEFDTSELRAFTADLERSAEKVHRGVRGVVSKGALKIRREMQMDLAVSTSFKGITYSPDYDLIEDSGGVEAVIGPNKGRSGGALANIAYFGSSRGGGTVREPYEALAQELPHFTNALLDLMGDSL